MIQIITMMMMLCLILSIFQHCMMCIKKRVISSTHDTYNRRILLQVGDVDRTLDLSSNDFCGVMVQYPDTNGELLLCYMMIDDRWMLDDEMWRSCDHNNGNWCEIFLQSSLLSSQSTITITYTGTVRDWSSFTALAHRYLIIMRPLSSNYTDNVSIYLMQYTST